MKPHLLAAVLVLLGEGSPQALEGEDDHWWDGFGNWHAPAPNGPLEALAVYKGNLIVGGTFTYPGGNSGDGYVARWDGTNWWQLANGIGDDTSVPGYLTMVRDLEVYGEDLIVGGNFDYADGWITGFRVNNIARWDGSRWYPMGLGVNQYVTALTTYAGDLIASGAFTEADGQPADFVARWDGSNWTPMFGLNGPAYSFATYEGALIAAGSFNEAGGQSAPHLAKWDGSSWSPFGTRTIDDGALIVWNDTLFANAYYTINGYTHLLVSWWDGVDWQPLGPGLASAIGRPLGSFAVYSDQLVAAGQLDVGFHNIARWDGLEWRSLGSGVSSEVLDGAARDLAVLDGSLYVGGRFDTAGGKPSPFIARWDDVITPVALEDFTALATPTGVRLSWRLASAAPSWVGIHVQRAEAAVGPFRTITRTPLVPIKEMVFLDEAVQSGNAYAYRLVFVAPDGTEEVAGLAEVFFTAGAAHRTALAGARDAGPGQPIPLRFTLARGPSRVRLALYEVRGGLVHSFGHEILPAGEHVRLWDRTTASNTRAARGVYIIRLDVDGSVHTQKLALVHD